MKVFELIHQEKTYLSLCAVVAPMAGDVEVYGLSGLQTRALLAEQYQQHPE